uniref:Uncharacterized protein n=1 Tax=Arion vulgaris TaxID=1028688 RepID=A0A0B7B5D8_9EUPU
MASSLMAEMRHCLQRVLHKEQTLQLQQLNNCFAGMRTRKLRRISHNEHLINFYRRKKKRKKKLAGENNFP